MTHVGLPTLTADKSWMNAHSKPIGSPPPHPVCAVGSASAVSAGSRGTYSPLKPWTSSWGPRPAVGWVEEPRSAGVT